MRERSDELEELERQVVAEVAVSDRPLGRECHRQLQVGALRADVVRWVIGRALIPDVTSVCQGRSSLASTT